MINENFANTLTLIGHYANRIYEDAIKLRWDCPNDAECWTDLRKGSDTYLIADLEKHFNDLKEAFNHIHHLEHECINKRRKELDELTGEPK